MTSEWCGAISQLQQLIDKSDFISEISRGYEFAYPKPTETEILSRKISIPDLLDTVSEPKFANL